MVLVQKGNIGQKKFFYDILQQKNAYLGYKNKKFKKVKKLEFFQRGERMVLVQKWLFSKLFFLRQYRPGKCV